jgi:predicted transcriptional regulator
MNWTFLSNHSHVLACLNKDPESRLRDVALEVDITERAVQKIVADLEQAEILTITKVGRRNRYTIHRNAFLRHSIEAHCSVGQLLDLIAPNP